MTSLKDFHQTFLLVKIYSKPFTMGTNFSKCHFYFKKLCWEHGLRAPNEGINQRNLKISAIPKNLGVGLDFLLCSEGDFLTGQPFDFLETRHFSIFWQKYILAKFPPTYMVQSKIIQKSFLKSSYPDCKDLFIKRLHQYLPQGLIWIWL